MSFYWPIAFWFLLLPLALAALELRRYRVNGTNAHPKILRAEAGPRQLSLTSDLSAAKNSVRIRWRLWLGLALTIVAFARPQWGKLEEPSFDQSREIIIALDLSRSMLSEDVRPSRLERAKLLVSSLLERLNGERVGLVVFSGTAFLQSPLSADYEILREFLPDLNTRFLPEGGTDYTALLKTTLSAFGATNSADRYLIILSDGEATDDDWKPLAAELKTKGIRVIGLGIGTNAGAMIPDGTGAFVKDERGAVVLSKLESATLQQLATETNGVYADASAWVDLAQLIQSTVDTGQKGSFVEHSNVRLAERFQWALAPAVLLLLWSFWFEFPVHPRLRDVKLVPSHGIENQKSKTENPLSPSTLQSVSPLLLIIAYTLSLITCVPHARAEEKEAPAAEPLSKLVASYAQRDNLAARDYAELARTTLTYGQRLLSSKKEVPAGPVNDALAAVEAGRSLDTKAADWSALQRDLEALLKKKEEPPPKEQPQQKKPEQQKEQQQQQQNSSQQNQQQNQQDKPPPEKSDEQKNDAAQKPPPPKDQSAFGDMKDRSAEKSNQPPPPADPSEQQKVGGTPEKKADEEPKDPALAVPLQKLDQLKNQDSPVQLYQLMQDHQSKPKKTGKDW
jgi:Ca-activated chloride channel family protein